MNLKEYQKIAAKTIYLSDPLDMVRHAGFGLVTEIQKLEDVFEEMAVQCLLGELENSSYFDAILEKVGNIWWFIVELAAASGYELTDEKIMLMVILQCSAMEKHAGLKDSLSELKKYVCGNMADYLQKTYQGHRYSKSQLTEFTLHIAYLACYLADPLLGFSLGEIFEKNVQKLRQQYPDLFAEDIKGFYEKFCTITGLFDTEQDCCL